MTAHDAQGAIGGYGDPRGGGAANLQRGSGGLQWHSEACAHAGKQDFRPAPAEKR
jgi:hypothetical protein